MCKDLGIDDPVAWFNSVPEAVLDGWYAYYSVEADEMSGGSSSPKMMNPADVGKQMQERANKW